MLENILYPEVLEKNILDNTAEIFIKIPADLAYFAGHFKGMPVVPGVVQLHWAVKFSTELFQTSGVICQGKQIKFSKLMRPNDEVCLTLEYLSEKNIVNYHYKMGDVVYSSGRLIYEL